MNRTRSLEGIVFPDEGGKEGGGEGGDEAEVEGNNKKEKYTTQERAKRDKKELERRMLLRGKSHIKHHFKDQDDKKATLCKFVCTTFWATQFQAVRSAFLVGVGQEKEKEKVMEKEQNEDEFAHLNDDENFIRSLASSFFWAANGGKSGATFAKTSDGRFVVKTISRTELQMFIECAPAYFEYMSKVSECE